MEMSRTQNLTNNSMLQYTKGGIMKTFTMTMLISFTLFTAGCNNHNDSEYNKAVRYCIENKGTVIQSAESNEKLCQYESVYGYDDGEQHYISTCELMTYYTDQEACHNLDEEGIYTVQPLTKTDNSTPLKLREAFYRQIKQILEKMDNTGYTHRTSGPFVLHPNYTDLIKTENNDQTELNLDIDEFNLFLDCSGFVGYYIVHGIAKSLYDEIDTCYHSSRPLAADFADTFKNAEHNVTEANVTDALLSDLDTNASAVMWGRVPHIKDALPGDIIVYKHSQNIIHHGECNNTIIKHRNTGHVLFIMEKPKSSTKYRNEWLVRVADSTTAPHSTDSRYSNNGKGAIKHGSKIYNKSSYGENEYTAWTKRYNKGDTEYCYYDPSGEVVCISYDHDDWLELCDTDDNNTFHRRCSNFGDSRALKIEPQTKYTDSSTGIGIGYIYVSDDMKHYRVKKGAERKKADIFIGRPVKVESR